MSETKSGVTEGREQADNFQFHQSDAGKPSIIHVILLNRTLRILCALSVFCMLIPILDYFYFYSTEIVEYQIDDSGICSHYPIYQIPCGMENTSETACIAKACCYSARTGCYHFLPSKYQLKVEQPLSSSEYFHPTKETSPLDTRTFSTMKIEIEEISEDILSILLWNPEYTSKSSNSTRKSSHFEIKIYSPELFVEVKRRSDGKLIFSTTRGALIASENYFEWSFFLGNDVQLMGFDALTVEEGQRILINNERSSVIPFIVAYDPSNKFYHAVYFESIHSPAEIQILKSNTIIVRQYYSISFGLKLITSTNYANLYRHLHSFTSHYLPIDFWSFGVHFCHTNGAMYNETETKIELNHLLMDESLQALPFDSHCLDTELTALIISKGNVESTFDGYEKFIAKLRDSNKKLLVHMCLSAIELPSQDTNSSTTFFDDELFLKDDDGANFAGIYGKTRKIHYLDYITKSTKIAESLRARWHQLAHFLNQTDGFFLQRAHPFDDTANKSHSYLERLAFHPKSIENEIEHLMPLSVVLGSGELLIHQLNNYGREQIEVFQQTLNDGKKLCIVDSYREASECGMLMREPKPTWTNFLATIHKSVFYSLIGMSFYGAEVCGGHYGTVAEDLCIRWYQFAIFTPLFYVNSHRMPTKFTKYAERIMVNAIRTRYSLLGYMWTCMHMKTAPLLRPLRYAYAGIDGDIELIVKHQFMFGDALMIAPIVEPLVVELNLHFPETYYEMWSGLEMPQNTTHFSIVMHDIPIFIRAGHIVALNLAYESLSAVEARRQPYELIVALACTERYSCNARGEHRALDGLEFKFEASEIHLNITVITHNPGGSRNAICGPEPFASGDFRFAKIYGLGEFKEKYRNDYLSLDLNLCDVADWKESFSFSFSI